MNVIPVSGYVQEVKMAASAAGTIYSVYVNGQRYGCFTTNPNVKAGDKVEFVATQKGEYWNVKGKVTKLADAAPAVTQSAPDPTSIARAASTPAQKSGYEENQRRIQYQSARNAAIEFLKVAVSLNAIPSSAKKQNTLDGLKALVDQYTVVFFDETDDLSPTGAEPAEAAAVDTSDKWD